MWSRMHDPKCTVIVHSLQLNKAYYKQYNNNISHCNYCKLILLFAVPLKWHSDNIPDKLRLSSTVSESTFWTILSSSDLLFVNNLDYLRRNSITHGRQLLIVNSFIWSNCVACVTSFQFYELFIYISCKQSGCGRCPKRMIREKADKACRFAEVRHNWSKRIHAYRNNSEPTISSIFLKRSKIKSVVWTSFGSLSRASTDSDAETSSAPDTSVENSGGLFSSLKSLHYPNSWMP